MTSTSGPAWGRAVLVTGVPRSGTTWLARLLAQAPRTAMPGREPMNPHAGQFRLAGTLQAWSQLDEPTGRQRRALWRSYRGLEPRTYGRLGVRSWAAPLPWTTVVVKDPFALLALPTVIATTQARPVLVFRHPAAVLASYRRMGWTPDVAEIVAVEPSSAARAPGDEADDVDRMAFFWSACHQIALRPAPGGGTIVCVSHEEHPRWGAGCPPAVRGVRAYVWGQGGARRAVVDVSPCCCLDVRGPSPRPRPFSGARGLGVERPVSPQHLERLEAATRPVRELLHQRSLAL